MALSATSKPSGFTLIENVIAIAVFTTLISLTFWAMSLTYRTSLVRGTSDVVIAALASANARARNGLYGVSWGVYLDYDESTRDGNQVIVFALTNGSTSFADPLRNTQFDVYYDINPRPRFFSVDLSGGGVTTGDDHEIIFAPLTGATSQWGDIDLAGDEIGVHVDVSPLGHPNRTYQ